MTLSAVKSRNIFRACVATAVREGEAVMSELVEATLATLAAQESESRANAKRELASEALALLRKHRAALIKNYPPALLETFTDGSRVAARKPQLHGVNIATLTLVGDEEVQAQVELSRAQQIVLDGTEHVLTELNGLLCAAQGLRRIQPERNPLRPENYILALQRVVSDTQVVAPVRQAWMSQFSSLLGEQLVGAYERATLGLRKHGIEQVGWNELPAVPIEHGGAYPGGGHPGGGYPGGGYPAGGYPAGGYPTGGYPVGSYPPVSQSGGGYPGIAYPAGVPVPGGGHSGPGGLGGYSGYGGHSGLGGYSGYGAYPVAVGGAAIPVGNGPLDYAQHWQGAVPAHGSDAQVEEALLSADIVRQLLASGGDPYEQVYDPASQGAALVEDDSRGAVDTSEAELMEDMAEFQRVVGDAGAADSETEAAGPVDAEVVTRMIDNIANDSRFLPPIQQAMRDLEPALLELVAHDPSFFNDADHAARRLLDDIAQRSLVFAHVTAPGFRSFMRLIDQAVVHLLKIDTSSAAPFAKVHQALVSAWQVQHEARIARKAAEQQALRETERRELRAERVAHEISALDVLANAPPDIVEFVLGPWVDVVSAYPADESGALSAPALEALGLATELLWSVQPEYACDDVGRLDQATLVLPERLLAELERNGQPADAIEAFLRRVAQLHQEAQQAAAQKSTPQSDPQAATGVRRGELEPEPELHFDVDLDDSEDEVVPPGESIEPSAASSSALLAEDSPTDFAAMAAPDFDERFKIGLWVELRSEQGWLRTQLTWVSPHNTLFMYTAPSGSVQSMTRRVRDKMLARDDLRVVSPLPRQDSDAKNSTRQT